MTNDLKPEKIILAAGYTDMRLGIDGLATLVSCFFDMNPRENTLFLFCGRRADRIKGLLWQEDGFLLLYKRLDNGRFRWPRTSSEAMELTPQQLRWLLDGLSIHQNSSIKSLKKFA